jgi:A/G-specific adenine glycosylase
MDYGASMNRAQGMSGMMKVQNPNRRSAHYAKQSAFAGSDRELRGRILRIVLAKKKIVAGKLLKELAVPRRKSEKVLTGLYKEGFLVRKGNYICINT